MSCIPSLSEKQIGMERFSERQGLKPKKTIQVEAMDEGLRNRLWNVVGGSLRMMEEYGRAKDRSLPANRNLPLELWHLGEYPFTDRVSGFFCDGIWDRFFKLPKDDYPLDFEKLIARVKEEFYRNPWNEAYDIIEFIAQNHPSFDDQIGQHEDEESYAPIQLDEYGIQPPIESYEIPSPTRFVEEINQVLQEEQSGYCLIGDTVTPIHAQVERQEVEAALDSPDPVAVHIERALELLSDRKRPDYRNSIKEAISAVESIANSITKSKNPSLGKALPKLEKKLGFELHPTKRQALLKLYGWASDQARHGLLEESHLTQEDAQFAIVVCSAFVNYLKAKAAMAEMSLELGT